MGYDSLRYFGVSHHWAIAYEGIRVSLMLALIYSVWQAKHAKAAPLGMHQEFVHCIERGACRFELVCPFRLDADPSRCFMETCHPLEGHLLAVHNALEYSVNLTWHVVGNATHGGNVEISGQTTRYLDTHLAIGETHSVSLAVDGQDVSIVLLPATDNSSSSSTGTSTGLECTPDETCDYLLRACYGVQEGEDEASRCIDYARHCHGFAKVDEERRQACIPSCLDTYYGHFFQGKIGGKSVFEAYDSDLLVAILLELKARGVDLSEAPKDAELGAEGFVDGTLSGAGFDLCTLTQCHGGGPGGHDCPSAQEVCQDFTSSLVIISIIFIVLLAAFAWFIVRRCRASYRHGNTFAPL